ncbi:hypothetical protein [Treponema zioleckii]|uniref:hypothetical protein n=1 Tax=Treponema zioleckii TaxID=331680 RepID=UPI00168B2D93|nr:hypothetical protein [Treponema zioleckii]
MRDSFYWLECSKNDSIYSAAMHYDDFKKFDTSGTQNIKKIVGDGEHYVWLRAEFTVPSYLRFRSLAMVISSLTFADKLWLNKTFIDSYGEFPPNGRSALFESHYYSFPENALNSSGKNVIYIKVCTLGKSSISDLIYIGEPKKNQADFL